MKAQLLKTTLYICDLENSLSWNEIENLIKDRALNGISVNCICHFADKQIGKRVEWDDDIDLNQCGCPTATWDKYFTPPTKPKTNADRIRAMSDEELEKFINHFNICDLRTNDECKMSYCACCEVCVMDWLKQPAD